jgi:hypothetical protein
MEEDKLPGSPTASAMEQVERQPDLAKRKSRKWIWITAMVLIVILMSGLIIPLAVVYGRAQSDSAPMPDVSETLVAQWSIDNFKQLISFGDSYTDEARAKTFDDPHPLGWIPPTVSRLCEQFFHLLIK